MNKRKADDQLSSTKKKRIVTELIQDINNGIKCPISKQIIRNPVVASDGYIYECNEIESWLKSHSTSPVTNLQLTSKSLYPCFPVRSIMNTFLETYPEKKEDQYTIKHCDYIEEINKIITLKDYTKLLGYSDFDLSLIDVTNLIKNIPTDIIKHILNH